MHRLITYPHYGYYMNKVRMSKENIKWLKSIADTPNKAITMLQGNTINPKAIRTEIKELRDLITAMRPKIDSIYDKATSNY